MPDPDCVIVGAGICGAAAAWGLVRCGRRVTVIESADLVAGHVRESWWRGIPFEPEGAHIFHTKDAEIWALVTSLVSFVPYRHRVLTRYEGETFSWPLQLDELVRLTEWPVIRDELAALPRHPDLTSFESVCLSSLGRTLFEIFVRDYTLKHWARPPSELSSSLYDGRVGLRDDGVLDLFRDPFQGWPRGGYAELVEKLLTGATVITKQQVTVESVPDVAPRGVPMIVTSALDDFFTGRLGSLGWRGVRLEASFHADTLLAQPAMVVNEPSLDVPWTRAIETKWVRPDLHNSPGTVVMREYPGAHSKHYPVPDEAGRNATLQSEYLSLARDFERNPLICAGRLGRYSYINMDTAIRQGLEAAAIAEGAIEAR